MSLAVQAQNFTLSGSGCTNTATSILLKSFKLPDGTTNIVMANFGPTGYGTLEPGTTKEESIKFTGVTQNANGTATLTGVTRGLAFVSPFAETTANKFSHAGGAIFIISNTSAYESELVDAANDQTIGGVKTFTSIPVLPASSPTTDNQATRKKYVDDGLALKMALAGTETITGQKTFPSADANRARIDADTDTSVATAFVTLGQLSRQAIAGAANASTTVKGIVEEATEAEIVAGTAAGATLARLFINPTAVALSGVNKIIRTGSDGKLDASNLGISDTQIFTSSSTWTKPANAKKVVVIVIGGGGNGANGGTGSWGTTNYGGAGGGGGGSGALNSQSISSSILTPTVTVTVGAATIASSFGSYMVAGGGTSASGATAGNGGTNSGTFTVYGLITKLKANNLELKCSYENDHLNSYHFVAIYPFCPGYNS